ncbi:DUF5686 and carboxypeptidase-like regulatory domain-containing protein [Mucilaginibacter flavus]|uniref:DUF5686 and carboxypeptidase-like regulatory domain-containing protein n=1 Tax=Mucilaginibacter flavus TaxID=931504 RepID=UPI0025B38900|nr:DUF5686 and carboxypeptidase-like regulatory domain-containing protein [Mucilaginibacter flavus]MDN3579578.1 DUF5686 family protein [Mucilaginibacter flavus]
MLIPLFSAAQQTDSVKAATNNFDKTLQSATEVSGTIKDAVTGKPLPFISVKFTGSTAGTSSDIQGAFNLRRTGLFSKVTFSHVGYPSLTKIIKAGQVNELHITLKASQTQLKEVAITSTKKVKYRNKGNPAVELIQQVIDHKPENRAASADYLQYDQYERTGFSFFDISARLIKLFDKYKFMLDTTVKVNGQTRTTLPVFFTEKLSENYYRKNPSKSIQILKAQKDLNILKFIDTAGVNIYLNRLYGNNIDIYENNIFILTNQFLSPIANHSPEFYKFFITDTIKTDKGNLIEISFTPRNKGDLLFEGKLLVTQDGRYAVEGCDLNVNKQININFMRSLQVQLSFERYPDGRYYVRKSDVKADFGILKKKGLAIYGERTVLFTNYKLNTPMPDDFYRGKSMQQATDLHQSDTGYWEHNRPDSLTAGQAQAYKKIKRLESMHAFKRDTWWAATLTGGYANTGPVQIGPLGSLYAFDTQEGSRFQIGGRSTPQLSKSIYLQGFAAYGTKDKEFKYNPNIYYSFNKNPVYRYPNDYIKVGYLYDVNVPGHNYAISNAEATLSSFSSGKTDYWVYSRIFTVDYLKEFENHFSYDFTFKNWNQRAAGTLLYQQNDEAGTLVHNLTTTEVGVNLRYAPHEQVIQGTQYRHIIYSKYPILTLQVNHDFKGLMNGSYSYTNFTGSIVKRFYLSQLGFTDVTLMGNYLIGKVPFPLLNISAANQSIAYNADAYNGMNYLEFVSDHYAGFNLTQSFNGFFLNKIPLIEHLKWREYLSFKILYGGLRTENNPLYSANLYRFPSAANGANGTFALGNTPYVEVGAGIGNIFKILRVDVIKRLNYLDHPGTSVYGIKLSFAPDF